MEKFDIYKDIASRTNGDIYIGVVGPVRTGKSTFITKFMQTLVVPNISNKLQKQIALDEMPQSADGKMVMTTQPKFVPANAVKVQFKNKSTANVRLVDCVGYMTAGANGFQNEDRTPRMVKTLWSEEEIPFEEAAEIGTHKVIAEHSTIAVLVTTDGSITDIPRENYVQPEERVVAELKQNNKPFVIVLNSKTPNSDENTKLADELRQKYNAPVLPLDVAKMGAQEIANVIKTILMEFPVTKINFSLPKWILALPYEDEFIKNIMLNVKEYTSNVYKMSDYAKLLNMFEGSEDFKKIEVQNLNLSNGEIDVMIPVQESLFYKTLSKECAVFILSYSAFAFTSSLV